MRQQRLFFCIVTLAMFLGACMGLKRGMDGSTFISTAEPNVAISVPSLPLRTAGEVTASVTTGSSLGGIPVITWLAVYGGTTPESPMAIVAHAEAPGQWYWDADMSRPFSIDQGTAFIGGRNFQTCTYIVDGDHDAFSTLVPVEDPNALRWIARRFAERTNFNVDKITLEYREPLPKEITSLSDVPYTAREFLEGFEKRAEAAFIVGPAPENNARVNRGYPEGIRTRFINRNFLGTMSQNEPLGSF